MATTRWKDTKTNNLNDAVNLLEATVPNDDATTGIRRVNWRINKVFTDSQEMVLFGHTYSYNLVRFSYDKITSYGVEDNIVPQNGFIIVYSSGAGVNYIIDKNSDAKLVLRKMLSYTGRSEIDDNAFKLESDFFLWLINRIYYSNNTIEIADGETPELELESIKGFSGDTEDSQTKVSASGESVMNIISTLSFFLESRRLKQIKVELKYKNHERIELILKSNTVEIDERSYRGDFEAEEADKRIAKLYLMGYVELLPVLIQEYQTDIENDSWNTDAYVRFMNNVSDQLKDMIQAKTNAINAGLPELNEAEVDDEEE